MLNVAEQIYNAKIRTGLYNDYDEEMRMLLYADCVRQAEFIEHCDNKAGEA